MVLQVFGITYANEKVIARARALVFENILRQPVGWFDLDASSPGILINRLARNAPLIKQVCLSVFELSRNLTQMNCTLRLCPHKYRNCTNRLTFQRLLVFIGTYKQKRVQKSLKIKST